MRIRTIKPEFWEDEVIGALSRDARLLFIATWNLADDEGLLRWTPEYLKASAFIYDEDVDVVPLMSELTLGGLVFAYAGGRTHQRLGWIPMFLRHQRINRPQPSKLPPPSIQSPDVLQAYVKRDGGVCHLCGDEFAPPGSFGNVYDDFLGEDQKPSLDHLNPRSLGGLDYPSNLKAAHRGCNSGRGNQPLNDSPPLSLSDALNGSLTERKGREGKGIARKRDEVFDALVETQGSNPAALTKREATKVGVALAEIRSATPNVTPDEVRKRAENYRQRFPGSYTANALAAHWSQCDSNGKPTGGVWDREAQ